ncbi:TIGR03986 family CRISPR-associated RAMP protein [Belliella kenyensis]|uniref:TIGR03986 family CRISPR-associated RAMP protein n=1 Tax=Belliella kenyensis TaxID=1472724 RepID=A0ABV8EQ84_9BACT|nr:TIGR03986 family CRISPR-associated RAMP protein [Belliella kenyensis]MCH7402134.1 TIGR03986 family CRISPR-associated RAMP protein [Belliella kenyensis]MDN3601649.1 TIGR03986 family CRISPR-associated RAMP protein [Belliella kenyensis]
MITAPYNFVPLNDHIVTPYWGSSISHDKPFIDSQSGVLNVEIIAKSPIFVRNGEIRKKDKDGKDIISPDFNQFRSNYFIPGSSIKGMLRNFIEAMTYGKMEDKVNDVKYSVRDFNNNVIYPKSDISKDVQCGWLRFDGVKYFLTPCGRPGRISHKSLDLISGPSKISEYYQQSSNINSDKKKSAKAKYDAFPFKKDGYSFKYESVDEPEDGIGREKYIIDETGQGTKGTIVFTGQPGVRKEKENQGKQYEFIFFNYNNPEIPLEKDEEGKPHEIIRNLFHAYYDHDKGQQKDDWKWRKAQLLKGKSIPVFFRLKDYKKAPTANNLLDIGLALLYKITYNFSVKESIQNYQKSEKLLSPDFADCLFGYIKKIGKNKFDSLKGRVMISHAFAEEGSHPLPQKTDVLGGPKASYYPNYIQQNIKDGQGKISGNYFTFKDQKGRIRGWKKYPVRLSDPVSNPAPIIKGKANEDVASKYSPLAKGTKFTFKIAYHNLRKEELGALISALTFHGNEGYYHNIGMAKPLGYGKISLSIQNKEKDELNSLLKEFECFMNYALTPKGISWIDSPQVKELFSMAKPSEKGDKILKYQKMDMENRINDFNQAKKDSLALLDFSKVVDPVIISGKASAPEIEQKKAFHTIQASYYESLTSKGKEDPTLPYKLSIENELMKIISGQKEILIEMLKEKRDQLKQEKLNQIAQKNLEIDQARILGKRSNSINLDSVKLNSRAFDSLEKAMKIFQVKFKNGPLEEEQDREILKAKLKEIFSVLPEKEKIKWKDSIWESNQYYKKISKWIGDSETKKVLTEN